MSSTLIYVHQFDEPQQVKNLIQIVKQNVDKKANTIISCNQTIELDLVGNKQIRSLILQDPEMGYRTLSWQFESGIFGRFNQSGSD